MGSRWKASVIAFLLFLTRSGLSHQSDDMDELLPSCRSKHEVQNGIVDVKSSVARGAELLQGRMTNDYQLCAEECCEDGQCDLALYRLEGLSDHGNNCYFIRCGDPAYCKIVPHDAFVFAFMSNEKSEGDEDSTGRENSPSVKPTESANSTVSPSLHESHTSPSQNPATENPLSTDAPGGEKVTYTLATEKIAPTKAPMINGSEMDQQPNSTDAPPKLSSDDQNQQLSTEEVDDCAKNGCNGTGIVIFGVLGGIAVLLLSLIVLALGKRVYDFYKRKQFGNVDYLINGMYA